MQNSRTNILIALLQEIQYNGSGILYQTDENKECYACTFMLQSVSKKRLSRYGNNEKGHFDIKISNEQMKKICNNIAQIAYNTLEEGILIDKKKES